IEAVSRVRFRNAELALVGPSTSDSETILNDYKGTVPLRVIGPQRSSRSNMRRIFSQASVLVLPSIEDGFGLVITQAMACGVPVIASTHSGGPDVITNGIDGFLVEPRSSAALEERLTILYENRDLLLQMSESALLRIQAMGGWTKYGDAAE